MAGKLAECADSAAGTVGVLIDADRPQSTTVVQPLRISLSGTVVVDFDVTITECDGCARHAVVRVEFPDEVRSMLEASTWTRGATIHEVLSRLASAFLERHGIANAIDASSAQRPPSTYHLPLAYVRSSLASVVASTT
jgi:hypothetical protein